MKTNYHHHKHHINHLHTVKCHKKRIRFTLDMKLIELKNCFTSQVLVDDHGPGHEEHAIKTHIFSKPPKGHASEYLHG